MALTDLPLRAGVNREGTSATAEGLYYDSDKVRFRAGFPETIGGWSKYSAQTFRGVTRFITDWRSVSGTNYMAMGSHFKFYSIIGADIYDITPIRDTETLSNPPFTMSNTSADVTVTDIEHGCQTNDFVTLSGVDADVRGIPDTELNAEHQVTVLDVDNYTITVTTPATSSGTGGSGTIVAAYQLNVGLNIFVSATGWGLDEFGENPYGSITPISTINQLRQWEGDNFGNDLIFNIRGGGVYYWEDAEGAAPPDRAVEIGTMPGASDTPTACLQIMTSDVDQHVLAFGCNPIGSGTLDPLFIRWADRENAVDWTPTAINSAGGRRLSVGSFIIGALRARHEIVIWTDFGVHTMRFIGGDLVFSMDLVQGGISLVGPKAAIEANGVVYFMDKGGFWLYNGAVQPVPCTLREYVFGDINSNQSHKIFAGTSTDHNEVTWYYPSANSNEVDRYVTYNYEGNVWYGGTMARSAWIDPGSRDFPIGAGDNGTEDNNYLYYHESGYSADGGVLTCYIESGDFDIDAGEKYTFIDRIMPDIKFRGTTGSATLNMIVKGKDYLMETGAVMSTTAITDDNDYEDIRVRARSFSMRVESAMINAGWRMGKVRVDSRPDGSN